MAAAVSDTAWLSAMLRFEAALANAQARLELIPREAADAIVAACRLERYDIEAIGVEALDSASPVLPLVDALRRIVGSDAASFVHRDATSQDAVDTAMMLVARDALDILLTDLRLLADQCAEHTIEVVRAWVVRADDHGHLRRWSFDMAHHFAT